MAARKTPMSVRSVNLIWLAAVLAGIAIVLFSEDLGDSNRAFRLFGFAATITSIVLGVVAIFFSIASGWAQHGTIGRIERTTDELERAALQVQEAAASIPVRLQEMQEEIVETRAVLIDNLTERAADDSDTTMSPASRVFLSTSNVGLVTLYAFIRAEEAGTELTLNLLATGGLAAAEDKVVNYALGYLTGLEATQLVRFEQAANRHVVKPEFVDDELRSMLADLDWASWIESRDKANYISDAKRVIDMRFAGSPEAQ